MELRWIPQYESKLASYLMALSLNPMPPGADAPTPTSLYEGKKGEGQEPGQITCLTLTCTAQVTLVHGCLQTYT